MYCITDEQIDFMLADIGKRGISIESLQQELLDHICIIIEQNLKEGGNFEACYRSVIQTFYKEELKEIEEETLFLLTTKGPRILLNRSRFFLFSFMLLAGPFAAYDIIWLVDYDPATMHFPFEAWGSALLFGLCQLAGLIGMLVLTVLFFTPENMDPLIPRNSRILLGIKPLIKIIREKA